MRPSRRASAPCSSCARSPSIRRPCRWPLKSVWSNPHPARSRTTGAARRRHHLACDQPGSQHLDGGACQRVFGQARMQHPRPLPCRLLPGIGGDQRLPLGGRPDDALDLDCHRLRDRRRDPRLDAYSGPRPIDDQVAAGDIAAHAIEAGRADALSQFRHRQHPVPADVDPAKQGDESRHVRHVDGKPASAARA